MSKSLYEIIGVSRYAETKTIETKCIELGKQYSPKNNPDDLEAALIYEDIRTAYEVLRNPEKRAEYDDRLNEKSLIQVTKFIPEPSKIIKTSSTYEEVIHYLNLNPKLNDGKKNVGIFLVMGIFIMPYIFSWFLLDRRYRSTTRAFGMLWMILILIFLINPRTPDKHPNAINKPFIIQDFEKSSFYKDKLLPLNSPPQKLADGVERFIYTYRDIDVETKPDIIIVDIQHNLLLKASAFWKNKIPESALFHTLDKNSLGTSLGEALNMPVAYNGFIDYLSNNHEFINKHNPDEIPRHVSDNEVIFAGEIDNGFHLGFDRSRPNVLNCNEHKNMSPAQVEKAVGEPIESKILYPDSMMDWHYRGCTLTFNKLKFQPYTAYKVTSTSKPDDFLNKSENTDFPKRIVPESVTVRNVVDCTNLYTYARAKGKGYWETIMIIDEASKLGSCVNKP